jgi:hypothetical protein
MQKFKYENTKTGSPIQNPTTTQQMYPKLLKWLKCLLENSEAYF